LLASKGWRDALRADPHLKAGLNVAAGRLTHLAVASASGADYTPAETVIA
jgi:alanine dehydrogenase